MKDPYIVLTGETVEDICKVVCKAIKNGYRPLGGVTYDPEDDGLMQAMILPERDRRPATANKG